MGGGHRRLASERATPSDDLLPAVASSRRCNLRLNPFTVAHLARLATLDAVTWQRESPGQPSLAPSQSARSLPRPSLPMCRTPERLSQCTSIRLIRRPVSSAKEPACAAAAPLLQCRVRAARAKLRFGGGSGNAAPHRNRERGAPGRLPDAPSWQRRESARQRPPPAPARCFIRGSGSGGETVNVLEG